VGGPRSWGDPLVVLSSRSPGLDPGVQATECLAAGIGVPGGHRHSIKDIHSLAEPLTPWHGLKERRESAGLNDKLLAANKSYVDLIGFVAHELKASWPPR